MNKTLLISAIALCSFGVATAQGEAGKSPVEYPHYRITALSPNGQYAVSYDYDGNFAIVDNLSGEVVEVPGDADQGIAYTLGYGNCVSNNGIVVGGTLYDGSDVAYYENGKWYPLPINATTDKGISTAHAITPDGSCIVGQIGRTAMGLDDALMQQPVMWRRNAENNGYDMYVELPFPEKDFLGATPQYVTAVCISADGRTIFGQIVDCTGFYIQPIVYNQDAEGKWSYRTLINDLMLNPDVPLPENPGDAPDEIDGRDYMTAAEREAYDKAMDDYNAYQEMQPQILDFMTPEEIKAYNDAMAAFEAGVGEFPWVEDFISEEGMAQYYAASDEYWANYPDYPTYREYMTEEEAARFDEAQAKYEAEYYAWSEKWYEYSDALMIATRNAPSLLFNTVAMSSNGKYGLMTDYDSNPFFNTVESTPCFFDLASGEMTRLPMDDTTAISTYVADNGAVIASAPASFELPQNSYIRLSAEDGYIPVEEYVKSKSASTYDWMDENMRHDFNTYEYNQFGEITVIEHINEFITGSMTATPDLSTFASNTANFWLNMPDAPYYYSYVIPVAESSALPSAAAAFGVQAKRGGIIELAGNVASVEVYDAFGRQVFSAQHPASSVDTCLGNGVYIIKAVNTDGKSMVVKSVF